MTSSTFGMADFLEDDDPSEMAEHRFGQQEWDKLEETFVNVRYFRMLSVLRLLRPPSL